MPSSFKSATPPGVRRRWPFARTLKPSPRQGLGWAALGVLAFSFTFPATVLAERSFDPLVVGAGRSVISAVIAAATLRLSGARLPERRHWPGLVGVALGCGIGFGVLTALALHHTSSTHGAVVIGLLPAATAVVAVLRVGDRPGPWFWFASLLGTAVVTGYALSRGAGSLRPADLLLLAAVVVAAVGYAEGGRLAREMPGWEVVGWGLLLSFPLAVGLTIVGAVRAPPIHITVPALLAFAYVGTVSTFYGFFAWYRGLAEAGVARASQTQLAQPLLTIVWSVPLLGETLDPVALLAALVVGGCVLITQRARASEPATGRAPT
ncbi:MAG: DMT family transporter, partial [Actinomycetota bacterium]|nr:DMT family transporter [Actinomycetota bacterium]